MLNARVSSILKKFPEAEKIFQLYEIEISEDVSDMSLDEVCDMFQVEAEDLILDLEEIITATKEIDWLNSDEYSQWTDITDDTEDTGDSYDEEDDSLDAPTDYTSSGGEEEYSY